MYTHVNERSIKLSRNVTCTDSQRTVKLLDFGTFLKEPSLCSDAGVVSGEEHSCG